MPCPQINIGSRPGACVQDGTRLVEIFITNTSSTSITVEVDFENDGVSDYGPVPLAPGAMLAPTITHAYPAPGTYVARVIITLPDGKVCEQFLTIVVPPCCDIAVEARVGDCNADGTRDVTIVVDNNGSDAVIALDYGDGASEASVSIPAGTLEIFTHNYPASVTASYTATVTVTSPTGCTSITETFTVGRCDAGKGMCTLDVDTAISPCDEDGNRTLTFEATVTDPDDPSASMTGSLSINGSVVDTDSGAGMIEFEGSVTCPAGSLASVVVVVPGCITYTDDITLPPCDPVRPGDDTPGDDEDEDDDDDGGGGGGDGGGSLCGWLCVTYAVVLAADVFAAASAGAGGSIWSIIATILTSAAVVALTALLISICGFCEWMRCTFYGLGLAVLAGIVLWALGIAWAAWAIAIALAMAAALTPIYKSRC